MRPPAAQPPRTRSGAPADDLASLLLLAADGDVGAFMRFYDATVRQAYRYARLRAGGAVDEAVRALYLRAWRSVSRYPVSDLSATAWLLSLDRHPS